MQEEQKEASIDISFFKKLNWIYVFLILFLILGFYLRAYHLDFPSIGYHNMKENEYLSEAMFFNEQGDFLHRRTFNFYGLENGPGYFEEYAQPPLIPYMTAIFWKIIGSESLWAPRLLMILFMLGSILLTYSVVKKLTKNEYLSLLSSFLMTIMPLGVYFGRNVQPESPALFCILLAANFYLNWIEKLDKKQLLYTFLAVSFAGMFKLTFLIIGIPFLFIFPYKEVLAMIKHNKNEMFGQIKSIILGLLPLIVLQALFELTIVDPSKKNVEITLSGAFTIFTSAYWAKTWPALSSYIADNYTWWFFWFAVAGLIFVILNRKSKFSRFMLGYAISVPLYIMILSGRKISGHSYYQMPFLLLVVVLSAYFLFNLGTIIKHITKIKFINYAPLLLILLTLGSVQAADNRVWGTVFYGQDFLGEYLKTQMLPDERFVAFGSSQEFAVCTYARHRCGDLSTLESLKEKEKLFDVRYIYLASSELNRLNNDDELWKYIKDTYKVDMVGLMEMNGQLVPAHIILKKGGKFNLDDISNKQPQLAKTYDMKFGKVDYYFIQNA